MIFSKDGSCRNSNGAWLPGAQTWRWDHFISWSENYLAASLKER